MFKGVYVFSLAHNLRNKAKLSLIEEVSEWREVGRSSIKCVHWFFLLVIQFSLGWLESILLWNDEMSKYKFNTKWSNPFWKMSKNAITVIQQRIHHTYSILNVAGYRDMCLTSNMGSNKWHSYTEQIRVLKNCSVTAHQFSIQSKQQKINYKMKLENAFSCQALFNQKIIFATVCFNNQKVWICKSKFDHI